MMCFGDISLLSQLFPIHPTLYFFSFQTHQDQFVLPKYSYMCGLPWEYVQLFRGF